MRPGKGEVELYKGLLGIETAEQEAPPRGAIWQVDLYPQKLALAMRLIFKFLKATGGPSKGTTDHIKDMRIFEKPGEYKITVRRGTPGVTLFSNIAFYRYANEDLGVMGEILAEMVESSGVIAESKESEDRAWELGQKYGKKHKLSTIRNTEQMYQAAKKLGVAGHFDIFKYGAQDVWRSTGQMR